MAFSYKEMVLRGLKRGLMVGVLTGAGVFFNSFVDVIPVEYSIWVPVISAITATFEKMLRNYTEFKDLPA